MRLRFVKVYGDWLPLLSRLHGWECLGEGLWSDGDGCVEFDVADTREPEVTFILERDANKDRPVVSRLRSGILGSGMGEKGSSITPIRTHSGLVVRFVTSMIATTSQSRLPYTLNHAAFRVLDTRLEQSWWEDLCGQCTILDRENTWDPVARVYWPDVHLFSDPDFYLTIRGGFEKPEVDHVGWMAESVEAVDAASRAIADSGWPIAFGPEEIDGSYLVHFRGPDCRVHDIFFPLEVVRNAAELHKKVDIETRSEDFEFSMRTLRKKGAKGDCRRGAHNRQSNRKG